MSIVSNIILWVMNVLKKILELFLCFIFCVWEWIVISSIITVLCTVIFYKIGIFENLNIIYADEPIPVLNDPLKTYFYIE